jgi:hypothetical protein
MSMPLQISEEDLMSAENVDFDETQEYWNVYKLKDGSTLKVKLVISGIKRLLKHNTDGSPIYIIQSQNVVRVVDVPKSLMAKPKESTFKPV